MQEEDNNNFSFLDGLISPDTRRRTREYVFFFVCGLNVKFVGYQCTVLFFITFSFLFIYALYFLFFLFNCG